MAGVIKFTDASRNPLKQHLRDLVERRHLESSMEVGTAVVRTAWCWHMGRYPVGQADPFPASISLMA